VIGELNLETIAATRGSGTVIPLLDSANSAAIASQAKVYVL
jgi:hypothetical protein